MLRSAVYYLFTFVTVVVFAPLALLLRPLPYRLRYRAVGLWTHLNLWCLRAICRLGYRVRGVENIPSGPAIIMCKHQSAWETLAMQAIFPPHVWVLKRELLWLPIFGWGLATLEPIAIDRKAGRRAIQQVIDQGRDRLARGRWIMIFPEGTRVAPGVKHRYGLGGGVLAEQTGAPIVPVAHNAGLYWPRNSMLKKPGVVDVVIGPVIETRGRASADIMRDVETWIERESDRLLAEAGFPLPAAAAAG